MVDHNPQKFILYPWNQLEPICFTGDFTLEICPQELCNITDHKETRPSSLKIFIILVCNVAVILSRAQCVKVIHKDVEPFLNETVKKICFDVDL